MVTDPQTNTATNPWTEPITIHCAAAIARNVIIELATVVSDKVSETKSG